MTWSFSLKPVSVWKEDSAHDPERRGSSIAKSIHVEIESLEFCPVSKADEEERIVRAVILEPNSRMSAEDIRAASYNYMESGRKGRVNGAVRILENMIAPKDLRINNKKNVRAGSWMMTLKILDDEMWKDFQSGVFRIAGENVQEI